MAFVRPTLSQLVERVQADFVSSLDLAGAVLRRGVVVVFSRVLAGVAHMLHGHLAFLGRQLFPDVSDAEFLLRHADIYGYSLGDAKFAQGFAEITGGTGAVVPAGAISRRADGAEFEVLDEVVIGGGGAATVELIAVEAGESGNTDALSTLTFESPVPDVDATLTVGVIGIVGGADQEALENLRFRLLTRLRNPPQGGAAGDYIVWALAVPGVTRAWVYPQELGAGTVTVRFVRDDDASPIPSVGEVAEVQAYIDDRRPVTANVTVAAPIAKTWNFDVQISPDTPAVRAAIQAEVLDYFQREGEPGKTLAFSRLNTAVGNADGLDTFELLAPTADLTHATGEFPLVGTWTWS